MDEFETQDRRDRFWNRMVVIVACGACAVGIFAAVNDGDKAQQRHDMIQRQQVTTYQLQR